jgi:hypothetical protein
MLSVLGAMGMATSLGGAAPAAWRLEYSAPTEGRRPVVAMPQVAMNGRGEAIVAWVGCDSPRLAIPEAPRHHCPELRSIARSGSGRWKPVRPLLRSFVDRPHVSIDRAGNGLAVWIGGRYDRRELFAAVKARGRLGWSTPVDLAELCEPIHGFDVAANQEGAVVVVWTCASGETWARVRAGPDRRWGLARKISDAFTTQPTVAIDPRGNAVAAWLDCLSSCSVWASRFSEKTGAWGEQRRLNGGPPVAALEVAVNDSGALVTWIRATPFRPDRLEAAFGALGRPWSKPTTIWRAQTSTQPQDFLSRMSVAASQGGGFAVAWAAGQAIRARMRLPGGRWTTVRELSEKHSLSPRVLPSSRQGFVVAWSLFEPGRTSVVVAAGTAPSVWSPPRSVGLIRRHSTFELAAGRGGTHLLVWIELVPPELQPLLRVAVRR